MELVPFATVDDLAAGWRALSSDEEAVAETLLARATAQLSALLSKRGVGVDSEDDVQRTNLATVTCNMVRRSMSSGYGDGIASMSQGIGSTNFSVSYQNPDGSFYLSKFDRELLGIAGHGGAKSVRAAIHAPDGSLVEGW